MKGWSRLLRIFFSDIICSTCAVVYWGGKMMSIQYIDPIDSFCRSHMRLHIWCRSSYLLKSYNFCLFQHFQRPKRSSGLYCIYIWWCDWTDDKNACHYCYREISYCTLWVTKRTLPKDPVPRVTPISKSSRHNGLGKLLTEELFDILYNNRRLLITSMENRTQRKTQKRKKNSRRRSRRIRQNYRGFFKSHNLQYSYLPLFNKSSVKVILFNAIYR
jgi:hypothetical protein